MIKFLFLRKLAYNVHKPKSKYKIQVQLFILIIEQENIVNYEEPKNINVLLRQNRRKQNKKITINN